MSTVITGTQSLLEEIENIFPVVEMPLETELIFHKNSCHECDYLRADLEQYRDKEVTGETIRLVHQVLYHLSAKALAWILPHYLRFCFTAEAEYNQMETEFLIYSLAPTLQFQRETFERLSTLNEAQVDCVICFLEWCLTQEYWKEYCPQELENAISFLITRNKGVNRKYRYQSLNSL